MSKRKKSDRKLLKRGLLILMLILILFASLVRIGSGEIPVLMYHFVGTKIEAVNHPLMVSVETFRNHLAWQNKS